LIIESPLSPLTEYENHLVMLPKKPTLVFCVLFSCVLALPASAQNESTDQSLNGQYQNLVENSESFNEYKVIKKKVLSDFWRVVSDSTSKSRAAQKSSLETIKAKEAQIEELNATIEVKDVELASGEEEKASITVLGASINKSAYAVVSVILPIVLLGLIGLLLVKFKTNAYTTNTAVKNLEQTEAEYEEYKKKALETQMKLKRELQTERNKISEVNR